MRNLYLRNASRRAFSFNGSRTNVLATRFLLADGIAELEDFMPVGLPSESPAYRHVYRRIRCVRGSVRISVTSSPAFDYGRQTHDTLIETNGATFKSRSVTLALSAAVPLRMTGAEECLPNSNSRKENRRSPGAWGCGKRWRVFHISMFLLLRQEWGQDCSDAEDCSEALDEATRPLNHQQAQASTRKLSTLDQLLGRHLNDNRTIDGFSYLIPSAMDSKTLHLLLTFFPHLY